MANYCIDVETVASKPEYKEDLKDWKGRYQPNPTKEKIVCICALHMDYETDPFTFSGDDEKKILTEFWDAIKFADNLIGYNLGYDWTFLFVRSMINGVKVHHKTLIDLRKVLYNQTFMKGSLSDISKALNLKVETSNGSTIQELYEKGNWDSIKLHCAEDCALTKILYQKAKEVGIIK